MPNPTLLLIYQYAPPTRGGTPVVLHQLLSSMRRHRLEVFTSLARRRQVRRGQGRLLPGRYRYVLKVPLVAGAGHAVVRRAHALLDTGLALLAGVRVAPAARRRDVRAVLTVLDDGYSVIAAALCARLARKPYVVMVFDLWEENAYPPEAIRRARRWERRLLRGAAAVVVYCEAMACHYARKHGVRCEVISTPVELGPEPGPAPTRAAGEPRELLLAGAVYWAQQDAVRRALAAAAAVDGLRTTMVGDQAVLGGLGLTPDRFEPPATGAAFRGRLREADVLLLGLSLISPYPDVVRTATPARLADYMAAGRALVVHAPAGSHVAEYARAEDFAEVVDEPDEGTLREALRRVLADRELAAARAARARTLARDRHDAAAVASRFEGIVERRCPADGSS